MLCLREKLVLVEEDRLADKNGLSLNEVDVIVKRAINGKGNGQHK